MNYLKNTIYNVQSQKIKHKITNKDVQYEKTKDICELVLAFSVSSFNNSII